MAKLIYSSITSLDGYVADESGKWDWSVPDEEVHTFLNDKQRSVGTLLLGRRTYEVLTAWETIDTGPDQDPAMRDFALLWQAMDKVVYSSTLDATSTARTRLERAFDPEAVKATVAAADRDLAIGGPDLAARAIRAGLVDEWHLYVSPVVVGGGHHYLPGGLRVDLELLEERRFGNGVVFLSYRTRR